MYPVKYKIKNSDDYQIYIRESFSLNGKKYKKTLKIFKSANELKEKYGDVDEFIKNQIEALKSEKNEKASNNYDLKIDYTKKIDEATDDRKNLGYVFLQKAWTDLKIYPFIRKWKYNNKINTKYNMNELLKLLTFSRIIYPSSKLATSNLVNRYIEPFVDINIDSIYDSLDRIQTFKDQLTKMLSKRLGKEFGANNEAVYYDCTNFFFEIQYADEPDGLRDYGVEKNHRPDPIVGYGLLYSDAGYPIASTTYRGNTSETRTLIPLLKNTSEELDNIKIICADAGLNTNDIKNSILSNGKDYIFSQSIKKLSNKSEFNIKKEKQNSDEKVETIREWVCNGNDMIEYYNSKGRVKKYKERWIIRSSGLNERLIVTFDSKTRDFELKNIELRVAKANSIINNPSRLNYMNSKDGKQYVKKIVFNDKTGEIIPEKSELTLLDSLIEQDKKEAGYSCIVTSIFKENQLTKEEENKLAIKGRQILYKNTTDILSISGKRVEIEDCFRIMKTYLVARPIYVRKKEHIDSHLFTVYLSLVLLTYINKKYDIKITIEQLLDILKNFEAITLDETTYRISSYPKHTGDLLKKFSIEGLDCFNIRASSMNKILAEIKKE